MNESMNFCLLLVLLHLLGHDPLERRRSTKRLKQHTVKAKTHDLQIQYS